MENVNVSRGSEEIIVKKVIAFKIVLVEDNALLMENVFAMILISEFTVKSKIVKTILIFQQEELF
jgi:hypothetical protein